MLPSEYKAMKRQEKKTPKVHQKIANTFIENAISKSNLSALKTIYFLSTVLSQTDMKNIQDDKIIGIKIDKREMLKFTDLSVDTIIKTTKQMQQTSITFVDEDGIVEGMSLLPRYKFVPNKNIIEFDLYVRIAKMIVDVQKNYTNIDINELMRLQNKHALRLLGLLCRISQYDHDVAKRKKFTLENLKEFFGVDLKSWTEFERKILAPAKEELDSKSKFSFVYEADYEKLGKGRPAFKDATIDLVIKQNIQGKLLWNTKSKN